MTPLVGRESELAQLSAVLERTVTEASPQFALLVGEPGIGKSRLVRELRERVAARPETCTWRQGFCPSYGEEVAFAALSEILKSHAGVRDNDALEVVEDKLEAILPEDSSRPWLLQRLRALLGLTAEAASQEENFAAWRRFFENVASQTPLVVVLEDLHWASDALLDFIEHLVGNLADLPVLVLATARPELFERRPHFASALWVRRVALESLDDIQTARLVASVLDEPDERSSSVQKVVARCAGNPFFCEQSARLLADTPGDSAIPSSIQAVLAARIDALPPSEKALLADAAVIGSVFWRGALVELSGSVVSTLEDALSGLLERGLVRRL